MSSEHMGTDERIKILRDVHGPGQRASGARFRDEVRVCLRCKRVYRSTHPAGVTCLNGTKASPCNGFVMAPTAELGPRWVRGTEIPSSGPAPKGVRPALRVPCSTCGAGIGEPCQALGLLTTKHAPMLFVHAARKAA